MLRTFEYNDLCYVTNSTIPEANLGLFCAKDMKKGDVLCEYFGYLLGPEVPSMPHEYDIAYERKDGMTIVPSRQCPGRYINDIIDWNASLIQGTRINYPQLYNCKWQETGGTVSIVCTIDVAKRTEFFIDYGGDYWLSRMKLELKKIAKEEKLAEQRMPSRRLANWTEDANGLDNLFWLWKRQQNSVVC